MKISPPNPQFWGSRRINLSYSPRIGGWGAILALLFYFSGAAQSAVTVTPSDAPTIKRAIASHKGHVVVVNFWATWCGPCVAEFPALVQMSDMEKGRGVDVIAVSADSKRDIGSKVRPFLTAHHVRFPVYLIQASDPENFINAFDPTWHGDLPRTLIYNKQGKLVKILLNEQTLASFMTAVKPYL